MRDDLEGMNQEEPVTHWYLARNGQQFGSLSDVEMKKFKELGQLRANDLLWREGFSDRQPAGAVFEIARREKG